jgi:hypothetical protein
VKTRIATALVALFAALFAVAGIAAPAQAAMPSNAPRHFVSVWDGTGHTGAAYPISDDWTGCRELPTWFNDKASSVANNSASPARNIRFYQHTGCGGTSHLFYAGTYDSQLSSGQGNNTYTSYKFVS